MAGHPKVWRQHLTSEGAARNRKDHRTNQPVEWAQRDNQIDRFRTALQRGLCWELGRLRRSPWTSSHSIPSRYGLEELQSSWEASKEHSSSQPGTYQWSKTEESPGCGDTVEVGEGTLCSLYNTHIGSWMWRVAIGRPSTYQREPGSAREVQI